MKKDMRQYLLDVCTTPYICKFNYPGMKGIGGHFNFKLAILRGWACKCEVYIIETYYVLVECAPLAKRWGISCCMGEGV